MDFAHTERSTRAVMSKWNVPWYRYETKIKTGAETFFVSSFWAFQVTEENHEIASKMSLRSDVGTFMILGYFKLAPDLIFNVPDLPTDSSLVEYPETSDEELARPHRNLVDRAELELALADKVVRWQTTDADWVFDQELGNHITGFIYDDRPESYWVPSDWVPSREVEPTLTKFQKFKTILRKAPR